MATDGQVARAIAAAFLTHLGTEPPLGLDAREGHVVDGGLVRVVVDDLALVDDVPAVDRVLQDGVDVAREPRARRDLARVVRLGRWPDAFAGQALGDATPAVGALVGHAEDALHHLEVGARLVSDDQLLAARYLHRVVPERRGAVGPEALGRLRGHASLHVAGQLLRVPLGEPREDGPDQLPHRAVARVVLGERHDLDVGVVERGDRAEAVEHVAGNAAERPHVQALDAVHDDALLAAPGHRVALDLGALDEALVAGAALGGPAADPLVDEPVLWRDGHPVGGGAALDLGALLVDGLVLLGVAAPQVRGSDDGHGGLRGGYGGSLT